MKKEEPPKLTPRPEMTSGHTNLRNSSSVFRNAKGTKSRATGMPELKRIKLNADETRFLRNNNVHPTGPSTSGMETNNDVSEANENVSESSLTIPNDDELLAGLIPLTNIKVRRWSDAI